MFITFISASINSLEIGDHLRQTFHEAYCAKMIRQQEPNVQKRKKESRIIMKSKCHS